MKVLKKMMENRIYFDARSVKWCISLMYFSVKFWKTLYLDSRFHTIMSQRSFLWHADQQKPKIIFSYILILCPKFLPLWPWSLKASFVSLYHRKSPRVEGLCRDICIGTLLCVNIKDCRKITWNLASADYFIITYL